MTDTTNANNHSDNTDDLDLTQGNLENDENLQTGDSETTAEEQDLDDTITDAP